MLTVVHVSVYSLLAIKNLTLLKDVNVSEQFCDKNEESTLARRRGMRGQGGEPLKIVEKVRCSVLENLNVLASYF